MEAASMARPRASFGRRAGAALSRRLSVGLLTSASAWAFWSVLISTSTGILGAEPAPTPKPAPTKAAPTFTKDVAPILQRKCQACHRRDHVGPFALETYE